MTQAPRPPVLDPRTEEEVFATAAARVAAYVPGLSFGERSAGAGLGRIFARYVSVLAERVNLAPDKNRLAFYDQLGVDVLTAQAARAPIAFTGLPNVGDSHVPARSRVGATVEGRADPLVYETERGVALAAARLVDVVSLWPGRDAWSDHSAAHAAGTPFTLFTDLQPIAHEWYVGHGVYLAFSGASTIEIDIELAVTASRPLVVAWEYWDGNIWRSFQAFVDPAVATSSDSVDGTRGFSASGVVRLVSDCATSVETVVNGVTTHWIRARIAEPLPPNDALQLPSIDRVGLNTVVDRTLPAGACGSYDDPGAILADHAFAGPTTLDLTKTVQPLGGQPTAGATFALACDEIMTRPGAEVTLCFTRVQTPEEIADQDGADLQADVAAAQALVITAVQQAVNAASAAANAYVHLADAAITNGPYTTILLTQQLGLQAAAATLSDMDGIADIADLARAMYDTLSQISTGLAGRSESDIDDAASDAREAADEAVDALDQLKLLTPYSAALAASATLPAMPAPVLRWEYWNGAQWTTLAVTGTPEAVSFRGDGPITFTVPDDAEPVTLNGVTARFVRARLLSGGYGIVRNVSWKDESSGATNFFPVLLHRPPNVETMRLGYRWVSPLVHPEYGVTLNDFQYHDVSANAATRGDSFAPFAMVVDRTPALYLGFDRPLPADQLGVYVAIAEVTGETDGPALTWEHYTGGAWAEVQVEDETRALAVPGMLCVLWPGSDPAAPQWPRFGAPRTWLRARLTTDGTPRSSVIERVIGNCVWAAQRQTFEFETLGSSNGEPGQVYFARQLPVLPGEWLEVRELEGTRAQVEEPMLREELLAAGLSESDISVDRDARTGQATAVWVRWRARPNLLFADPGERAYAIERSRGRVVFAGGAVGLAPPAGRDNVRLRMYQAGGGAVGNVAAGAINQLLSGVLAEKVSNATAGEGGADGETIERVHQRAPRIIRHRRQAITAADYEDLALEASPAVAVARALGSRHPSGRRAAGWVTLRIVPHSQDARPLPSFGLREHVRRFIAGRVPAQVAGRVAVVPPLYQAIGVEALVRPQPFADAAAVRLAVIADLTAFLHPLTGGPEGQGWPFGRDVYTSDVARRLESIRDVDAVVSLRVSVAGTPAVDVAPVDPERLVVAGDLRVTLSLSEA